MATLKHRRQEAYCQARAKGLSQEDAAMSPGCLYAKKHGYRLEQDPKIQNRIVEITAAPPQWSVSRDIAPVIDQLVLAAQASAALGTGPGLKAAGDLWAKVADLKQKLPKASDALRTRRRPMTAEEWQAKFQPKC